MTHDKNDIAGNDSTLHLDDDTCTDILTGLLSRKEVEQILDHVSDCDTCEKLFVSRVADHEMLRASAKPVKDATGKWQLIAPTHDVAKTQPTYEERDLRAKQSMWKSIRAWLTPARAALAAGTAAIAVFLLFAILPTEQTIAVLEYRIPSGREFRELRSPRAKADDNFRLGVQAYDEGDVVRSIELLKSAEVTGAYKRFRNIYLGSALTLAGKYDEAIRILGELNPSRTPQPWRYEAEWTRYIALRNSGKTKEADILLGALAELTGEIADLAREEKQRLANQ